jgi:hypothetical protein
MSRTGTRIATIAAASGGIAAAFLAFSPAASADPAAPAIPGLGGVDVVSQLANAPTLAGQFLQTAASMLQGKPATPAAAPAAPAPSATASINLPQTPATAPLTNAVGTVPPTGTGIPGATAPSQIPLLNQLPLPGNLGSITQGIPGLGTTPSASAPASTGPIPVPAGPGQSPLPPDMNPFAALP